MAEHWKLSTVSWLKSTNWVLKSTQNLMGAMCGSRQRLEFEPDQLENRGGLRVFQKLQIYKKKLKFMVQSETIYGPTILLFTKCKEKIAEKSVYIHNPSIQIKFLFNGVRLFLFQIFSTSFSLSFHVHPENTKIKAFF